MSYAMHFTKTGGPEELVRADHHPSAPQAGEILVRQEAIGLNFVDVYHRQGLYPLPLPGIPGIEAVGIVEAIGPDVTNLTVGQRVVYAGVVGAYADVRLLPAWRAVPLPDAVPSELAASMMLRGLTAHMLLKRIYPVGPGTVVLVHSAAGGLGSVLIPWAKHLGAEVIGTVSTPAKAELARASGADHVIVGRDVDLKAEVMDLTTGEGVHFAIDGVAGSLLARTLACIRPFGVLANVGQVGGVAPPVAVETLRSVFVGRPSVLAHVADKAIYATAASETLAMMEQGFFKTGHRRYRLEAVADAHRDLEAGVIEGSAVLLP